MDRTKPNLEWEVAEPNGSLPTWERVGIAVLMDIRRELRALNAALLCPNFQDIPNRLSRIAWNTAKKRKRAATGRRNR